MTRSRSCGRLGGAKGVSEREDDAAEEGRSCALEDASPKITQQRRLTPSHFIVLSPCSHLHLAPSMRPCGAGHVPASIGCKEGRLTAVGEMEAIEHREGSEAKARLENKSTERGHIQPGDSLSRVHVVVCRRVRVLCPARTLPALLAPRPVPTELPLLLLLPALLTPAASRQRPGFPALSYRLSSSSFSSCLSSIVLLTAYFLPDCLSACLAF